MREYMHICVFCVCMCMIDLSSHNSPHSVTSQSSCCDRFLRGMCVCVCVCMRARTCIHCVCVCVEATDS